MQSVSDGDVLTQREEFVHVILFFSPFSHFNPSPVIVRNISPLAERSDNHLDTVHVIENCTYSTCVVKLVAVLSHTVMQHNTKPAL